MALYLTSLLFDGLDRFLARATGPVFVIGNASRELEDQAAIVDMATAALAAAGHRSVAIDVTRTAPAALAHAGAVLVTGGDPFRLLADLRGTGTDVLLQTLHRGGIPIAGQSAGAIVCGPTLDAIRHTSPFTAPAGLDLTGLGLTDRLVLPHHGRPGRSAAHRRAAASCADAATFTPLWDDEVLHVRDGEWHIERHAAYAATRTRPARPEDAAAIGVVFRQATLAAWSDLLGRDHIGQHNPPDTAWRERIEDGSGTFLVTEDAAGMSGFLYWRANADVPALAEVDLLFTHPRVWGSGTGRRLLERATWQMLAAGYRQAVLWTEARNGRALAVYQRNGWTQNGGVIERDYFGAAIRNLEHRLDLTACAGGA